MGKEPSALYSYKSDIVLMCANNVDGGQVVAPYPQRVNGRGVSDGPRQDEDEGEGMGWKRIEMCSRDTSRGIAISRGEILNRAAGRVRDGSGFDRWGIKCAYGCMR